MATGSGPVAKMALYPCFNTVAMQCDVFTSMVRFTLANNQLECGAWQSGNNILVYRVELTSVGTGPSDLYDTQSVNSALYQQGCNTNETGAAGAPSTCVAATTASPNFNYDLQQIASVLASWGTSNNGDSYGVFEASGSNAVSTTGGVGICVVNGTNCAGGTQDTDFYRSFRAGTLKNLAPVFAVGVLHSDSPDDFAPNGTTVLTAPVNNADYTGISIADDSASYKNTGVADAANPNSASEYYVPPKQRIMLGSAYTVLNFLTLGANGPTLYSQLPASVQQDIDNIYIHVFQRNDAADSGPDCVMQTCSNVIKNDVTTIQKPPSGPLSYPPSIPDADVVLFTERDYVLAPVAGVSQAPSNFTGAAVQYVQSPYIVCDTVGTGCGQ